MNSWIRRNFDGVGLTQYPPGKHLSALQRQFGGTVLLCIDVSGSMYGEPLAQAVDGGIGFLRDAEQAYYRTGLVLWHHDVQSYLPPDVPTDKVVDALAAAKSTGGNDLVPTLQVARKLFEPLTGDRVLCVFGDGDIGNNPKVIPLARELCAMGVRIVVRGLGGGATEALSRILCPGNAAGNGQVIVDVSSISAGIAGMAKDLVIRGQR